MKTNCGTDHTANRSIAYHTDLTQQVNCSTKMDITSELR